MDSSIPITLTENAIREPTYSVLVDMNNDGVYEVDITSDTNVEYIDSNLENRKTGEALGKPSTNVSNITLSNIEGRYSPNNADNIESEYPGQFRRNTKLKIMGGFIDSNNIPQTKVLFNGVIVDFKGNFNLNSHKMSLTLEDFSKFLKRKKAPNHKLVGGIFYESVLFNVTISESINYLIDYALGTSFSRIVNPLSEVHPVIEFPKDQTVWECIQKLAEACDARAYFSESTFYFITPLSASYIYPNTSQYTFTASKIYSFMQLIEEKAIINRIKITSNGKTLQPRQVVVGTPTTNIVTGIDNYTFGDGKNALDVDNKTITLKSQEGINWIDTIYMPLVDVTTYSDLMPPVTPETEASMNATSPFKVWNKTTGTQLTIQDIVVGDSTTSAKIILKETVNPVNYNIQITYQYYIDRIVYGKYKWYIYDLDKLATNIEYPTIEAHDGFELVSYSIDTPTDNLYLSDWEVLEGNTRVKFKLTNNVPARILGMQTLDVVYISKFEIYANPLDCISPLTAESIDATTIDEFENSWVINNDYIVDPDFASKVTDYYLYRYKQEKSILTAEAKFIPQIELGDRITLVETEVSGINFDFIVIAIRHVPKVDGNWKTTLTLESLIPAWVYDPANVIIQEPKYVPIIATTLPEIAINSNDSVFAEYANNLIKASVTIHFNNPAQYNITDFVEAIIVRQEWNGSSWGRYIYTANFNDAYIDNYTITGLQYNKNYKFYVIAVDKYNNRSSFGLGYNINIGTYPGLPDVTNLSMYYENSKIPTLTWSIIENIPNVLYEIRFGNEWATGQFMGRVNTNKFTCVGSGTYWVSGYYNGYYSTNPSPIIDITGIVINNIVATYEESDYYWNGILDSNLFVDYKNRLVLAGSGIFDDIPNVDIVSSIDAYGGIPAYGIYEIAESRVIDIGSPQTCTVGGSMLVVSNPLQTTAKIQINISQDGINYIGWRDLYLSQQYGRKFKFRIILYCNDTITPCIVTNFSYFVDVPDVIDSGLNVNVPISGLTINFNRDFHVPPSVVISILSAIDGDYFIVSNITDTSFNLLLKNGLTAISKYINWVGHGY